jgi:copper chaperone CopZ
MKKFLVSILSIAALTLAANAADVTAKLTDVHLCCQSCVKGVDKAVSKVSGVKADSDMDGSTITLTGPDTATVQKAVDALTSAGYYGKSSNPDIKVNSETGAKDEKVKSLTVEDVHLCCGKCVKSVTEALSAVPGVTGNTAAKGAKSFTINGDFNEKDAMAALQKDGLTGHVAQ